jgi:hypothetical protein
MHAKNVRQIVPFALLPAYLTHRGCGAGIVDYQLHGLRQFVNVSDIHEQTSVPFEKFRRASNARSDYWNSHA